MTSLDHFAKWSKIAEAEVAAVEAEAEREIAESDGKLGLGQPLSEAEAKDRAAHEELKKVKREWTAREKKDQAAKKVVSEKDAFLTLRDFREQPVLSLYECERLDVEVESEDLIKVFIERCDTVTVRLKSKLKTSFVEISRSRNVDLTIYDVLHTVQVDLSHEIVLAWNDPAHFDAAQPEGPKVYHAGTSYLLIAPGDARSLHVKEPPSDNDEQQFVSHLVDGRLVTEKIVLPGDSSRLLGATTRELGDEIGKKRALRNRARAKVDAEKTKGNDAFKNREYAQATAHYSLALADFPHDDDDDDTKNDDDDRFSPNERAVLLSNRAAAFLKLGQPEKALDDAALAADVDPSYPKAHFRKGLALHALQRYKEALPALGKAHDIEPKNAQITDAIRFAEMRLHRGAGNLRNPYH
eukprot:CAMPEP_0118914156 /NCGR_PEP_ID=MMETSP1166-20130328/14622_1 /TAXON_ID=1104430 /ORGANISM="Chrysoreinhardia sp, Strain CCMP3193" /LENGTH=410 /DNA_ID=CAMNT_0006853723 /DNA_START=75 /DNA_END=1307 /DNA_ORIENTATION=+